MFILVKDVVKESYQLKQRAVSAKQTENNTFTPDTSISLTSLFSSPFFAFKMSIFTEATVLFVLSSINQLVFW